MFSSALRVLFRRGVSSLVVRRSVQLGPSTLFRLREHRPTEIYLPRRWSHVHYDYSMIESRVMLLLRLFDKIDPQTIQLDSKFTQDLSLDSLDLVEITAACEDEFWTEIPDQDSDKFLTPRHIIQYLCDKFDVYEHLQPINAGKQYRKEEKEAQQRAHH